MKKFRHSRYAIFTEDNLIMLTDFKRQIKLMTYKELLELHKALQDEINSRPESEEDEPLAVLL